MLKVACSLVFGVLTILGMRRFSSTVRRADAPQTYNISDMITLVVTVSWSSKDDGAV